MYVIEIGLCLIQIIIPDERGSVGTLDVWGQDDVAATDQASACPGRRIARLAIMCVGRRRRVVSREWRAL
jgi:hypothetical protein